MPANPLIPQGTLNKLLAGVTWQDVPELNVTASYLNDAIRYRYDGEAAGYLPTLTGAVTSPNPYQMISVVIPLLKTQGLADSYKQRMQSNSLLGNGTVRPDARTLSPFAILNCSIINVDELAFGGGTPVFGALIKGYTLANTDLWNG